MSFLSSVPWHMALRLTAFAAAGPMVTRGPHRRFRDIASAYSAMRLGGAMLSALIAFFEKGRRCHCLAA